MTEDEEEDVSSYWKSKHYTALRGELAVEEAAYLSEDKLKNELSERWQASNKMGWPAKGTSVSWNVVQKPEGT